MSIHFEPMQVIHLFLIVGIISLMFWKRITWKWKVAIALAIIVIVLFNPFRFEHKGFSGIERMTFDSNEDVMPQRITAHEKKFSEWNAEELQKLQKESKEKEENEVHN